MAHREIDYSKMADKYESRYPDKDTNWVVPLGPNVNGFEDDLKAFVSKNSDGSESSREAVTP
ncbi:MAG: hypothetical protein ACLUCG_02165 [Segatella copri]